MLFPEGNGTCFQVISNPFGALSSASLSFSWLPLALTALCNPRYQKCEYFQSLLLLTRQHVQSCLQWMNTLNIYVRVRALFKAFSLEARSTRALAGFGSRIFVAECCTFCNH